MVQVLENAMQMQYRSVSEFREALVDAFQTRCPDLS